MAGIGDYAKGKKFTLKSGNKPSGFKMMGSIGMSGVADNLKKTSPSKSVDDKLNEVKTRRGSAGTYDINSLSFSPQEKNPDLEEQIKKNQTTTNKSRKEKSRKEETVEGGRLSPEQLQKNKDAEAIKVKKKEKKASRKEWRKDTGKAIASKAGEVVKDAATNALTKALTPKEAKRVNPTDGFNVQFGNKR